MNSDIAASLHVLEGELRRLDLLHASIDESAAGALRTARDHLAQSIEALAAATPAEPVPAEPERPPASLADRMVMLETRPTGEAFRTKVKIKSIDQAPAPVPVQVETADAAPPGDDLVRIRGIDDKTAARLAELGVSSFAAIAAWSHRDVKDVGAALGLGRLISRQNWIEQAAILAGRQAGAVVATPMPLATEPPILQSLPPVDTGPDPAPPHEEATPPQPAAAEPVAEPDSPPAVVAEPAPATPADDLTLIAGIDAGIAQTLRNRGIERWSQIAQWRRDDIAAFADLLPAGRSISKYGWIEQAAMLASGRLSHHATRQIAGDYAALVAMPADEPLPAPVFTPSQTPPAAPTPAPPVPPAIRPMAALAEASSRVISLERELASLVANDTATPQPPAVAAPVAAPPQQPAYSSGMRIEDEEFPQLTVGEADVMIVPRRILPPEAAADGAAGGSQPNSRMRLRRRVAPLGDIDSVTYAAYHDTMEEASVEIIKPGQSASVPPAPATQQPKAQPPRSFRRLFRDPKRKK